MELFDHFKSILGETDLYQPKEKNIKESFAGLFDLDIKNIALMIDILETGPKNKERARLILNNLLVHKCINEKRNPVEYIESVMDSIVNGYRLSISPSDKKESISYSDMGELIAAIGCKRLVNKKTRDISPVYECVYLLFGDDRYKPLPIGLYETGEILKEMDIRGNPFNWYTTRCMYEPKEETSGPKDPNSLYRLDLFGNRFDMKTLSITVSR